MNNLHDRIAALKERADSASLDIKEAEEALKELPGSKYTEFGTIKWDPIKRRIMLGDKPLIETKLKERLDGHYYLKYLVDRVIMNAEELFDELQRKDEDPTPYCIPCNAPTRRECDCGPIAANN